MIVTANHWFNQTFQERLVGKLIPAMAKFGVKLTGADEGVIYQAFVRQGFWVVLCQGQSCNGAEMVWEEETVLCCSCWNNDHYHKIVKSVFPKNRAAIEKILEYRPLINRNWDLPEELSKLRQENIEHGLPFGGE